MPDFTKANQLWLFLAFFLPGFLALKVFDLFVPAERRDFSKTLGEVVGYSALIYAVPALVALGLYWAGVMKHHPVWFWRWLALLAFAALFVLPLFLPVAWLQLLQSPWLSRHVISPIQRPWDWVFMRRETQFVVVTLKDGKQIGGIWGGRRSFATSFPAPEQLYLEATVALDEGGNFDHAVSGSRGILILSDIRTVEFFARPDGDTPGDVTPCSTDTGTAAAASSAGSEPAGEARPSVVAVGPAEVAPAPEIEARASAEGSQDIPPPTTGP